MAYGQARGMDDMYYQQNYPGIDEFNQNIIKNVIKELKDE
jgi:hypothetical protein